MKGEYIPSSDTQAIVLDLIPSQREPTRRVSLCYNDLIVLDICCYTGIIFRQPIPEDHPLATVISTVRGHNDKLYIAVE